MSSVSIPLTPSKLKTILPSLREAISNLLSSPSTSSSSSLTIPLAFLHVLLCELTSRGVDVSHFLIVLPPPNNSSTKDKTNTITKNDGSVVEPERIISVLELIRVVAGKLPIDDNAVIGTSSFPAPMMAALNATSGMAASSCLDALAASFHNATAPSSLMSPSQTSSVTLLPHINNPSVQEAIQHAMRRCEEVQDGRFYTLLQLLTFQPLLLPTTTSSTSSGGESTTSTATSSTTQQQQAVLALLQSFHQIAYANYLYGASNFASSLANVSQSMVLWKKCLDVALSNCYHDAVGSKNGALGAGGTGVGGNGTSNSGIHSAITSLGEEEAQIVRISGVPFSSSSSSATIPSMTTTSSSTTITSNEEYKSYLTPSSYYTIPPLRHMIQIATSRNNMKRVAELNVNLCCAYLGYVYERLLDMARRVNKSDSNLDSSGSKDISTKKMEEKENMQQLSMHELINKYYLRRSKPLVELQDSIAIEDLLANAEESLLLAVKHWEQEDTINDDTGGEDETQQQKLQRQQLILLHHYIRVQIHHLREETKIWKEIQHRHIALMNRRPEKDVSSGTLSGTTVGLGSTKTLTTTSETLEHQVRMELCLQAWDTAWQSRTQDDSASFYDVLNSILPSCLGLRDAIISCTALAATMKGGVVDSTSDIVQDCYASLLNQIKRLGEIAVWVSTASQRRREKGDRCSGDDEHAPQFIWKLVLMFVSSLMTDCLHYVVVTEVGNDADGGGGSSDVNDGNNGNLSGLSNNAKLRHLVECCSETIITGAWMCEPHYLFTTGACCDGANMIKKMKADELQNLDTIMPRLLTIAHACLTSCQKIRVTEEKERLLEEKAKQSVLSSKYKYTASEQNEILRVRYALASSTCRMDLINACSVNTGGGEKATSSEQILDGITTSARRATISAIAAVPRSSAIDLKSSTSVSSNFGTPYIQFLSAWSGMYQTPWPFCTLSQGRSIVRNARDSISVASKIWGRRPSSTIERLLLDIGEADLEGILVGGFTDVAEKLYRKTLMSLTEEDSGIIPTMAGSDNVKEILQVHCFIGLARITLSRDSDTNLAEKLAQNALTVLRSDSSGQKVHRSDMPSLLCIYAWSCLPLSQKSHSYHVCSARQLVAEACIKSRPEDALLFLTQAVDDCPSNSEALLTLAAFHLRGMIGNAKDENGDMKAKTLLLKAAKMDTSKSDPFALLGIWYELQNDANRARGCYQKAIAMESSHPVAGRGLQRLMSIDRLQTLCRDAVKCNSSMNGWAWRTLGQQLTRDEGDDTAALVCFQQALRCRDIQTPETTPLGVFYIVSAPLGARPQCEASETWGELASCYRRLGKFSAALRAFEAAYSVSGGNLCPDAFCAWAQVDLDLGLYEAAADTCAEVLTFNTSLHVKRMATFIGGEALLVLARERIQEGKFGSCLTHLKMGAARLKSLSTEQKSARSHYCEIKLLGDIYSCGHSLPSYVFSPMRTEEARSDYNEEQFSRDVECKLSFLVEGEQAYTLAFEMVKEGSDQDDDARWLVAAAATDLGTNLLSQAMVVQRAIGEGSSQSDSTSSSPPAMKSSRLQGLMIRSMNAYLSAIDASPCDASAWCGLGCALKAVDPIMAQHAFCRGIQLDPSLGDSWSNISLLYATHDKEKSSEVLDNITQIEDTPLTWIGRGLLLEETALEWKDEEVMKESCLTKAADAYRSALQICQHPAALLGLSLNCRRADPRMKEPHNVEYSYLADNVTMFESRMSLVIHENMTPGNIGASYVAGLSKIEEGLNRLNNLCPEGTTIISEVTNDLNDVMLRRNNEERIASPLKNDWSLCEMDLSGNTPSRGEKTEKYPEDAIKFVMDRSLFATSCHDLNGKLELSLDANNRLNKAQNKVLLNPESGEAWLMFANQLAQEVTSETGDTNLLSSGKIAAKRAYKLLHERVVNATKLTPRRIQIRQGQPIEYSETSVVSSLPAASLFSYSMALVSLLEETFVSDSPSCSVISVATIQESLLLDPSNSIAATFVNSHMQKCSLIA